jgi:hypothetical protein
MPNKSYKIATNTPETVSEPAVAYRKAPAETSSPDSWNPNVPFHGTQEEWWEHIHQIEEGKFYTAEEHKKRFETWKKQFLASRMYCNIIHSASSIRKIRGVRNIHL